MFATAVLVDVVTGWLVGETTGVVLAVSAVLARVVKKEEPTEGPNTAVVVKVVVEATVVKVVVEATVVNVD